ATSRGGTTMIVPGTVDIVPFPLPVGGREKTRPAVIIQCERLNQQIHNTVVAMMTGSTRLVGREPSQFLIDPNTPEGQPSGLSYPSAVKCENLITVAQSDIVKTIGHLSDPLLVQLDRALRS